MKLPIAVLTQIFRQLPKEIVEQIDEHISDKHPTAILMKDLSFDRDLRDNLRVTSRLGGAVVFRRRLIVYDEIGQMPYESLWEEDELEINPNSALAAVLSVYNPELGVVVTPMWTHLRQRHTFEGALDYMENES